MSERESSGQGDALRSLLERARRYPLKSQIRKGMRYGALLVGLTAAVVPKAEARVTFPQEGGWIYETKGGEEAPPVTLEARIEHLNEQIAVDTERLEELQEDIVHLERRVSANQRREDQQKLRGMEREIKKLDLRLQNNSLLKEELASRLDDKAYQQLDRVLWKAAQARAEGKLAKAERLEKKVSINLYDRATTRIDQYMASIGIRESGRTIIVQGVMGGEQPIEIAPGYEPDGFYLDERHDTFMIVLHATDGTYLGLSFEEGKLARTGACEEYGDFIEE